MPNARLEVLRCLARYRETLDGEAAAGRDDHLPKFVPLFSGEWANDDDDIVLAARECTKLGEIEMDFGGSFTRRLLGPMVRITDLGLDRIRAHDAFGETEQDA